MSLLEVSRLLGHRSITTTERWYAGMADSTLVSAIARVDRARELDREGAEVVALGARLWGR